MNRELQKEILERLNKTYGSPEDKFVDIASEEGQEMFYLFEHGLIHLKERRGLGQGAPAQVHSAVITARGRDFLEDDGGLSAILGVVTVRFHEDTLKSIIENKILDANIPKEEKRSLINTLKGLPADATRHLTMRLLDKGLETLPDAIRLIGNALQ
jgi:hypothetical protein